MAQSILLSFPALKYALVFIIVSAAAGVRIALEAVLGIQGYTVTFYPAVVLAGLYLGLRPCLLAILLSFASIFYIMPPSGSFTIARTGDLVILGLFLLGCSLIAYMTNKMRCAQEESEHAHHSEAYERQRADELERVSTALRESEQALRQSQAFLQVLTDNLPGMVGYWDTDLRCRFANKAYIEWFGLSPEEMIGTGMAIQELMGGELFRKNESFIRNALQGKIQRFERTLVKPSGEIGHTLAHYIPDAGEDGEIKGFFVLVSDVTPVKGAEIRLQELNELLRVERDRAELATRAKSDFLGNMSHEIRTPMNGVLGMTDLALSEDIPPRAREYLHFVKESGKSLLDIINDILDLSKIEAGKVELDAKPFRLRDSLESMLKVHAISARDRGLDFYHSIQSALPDHLVGDQGRLKQVLTNLIGNALKFTDKGAVRVSVDLDGWETSRGTVRLLFRVEDDGIGIPRERTGEIFEAFSQGGLSGHSTYGGTGLGLSISKRLVEMMHGRIWVDSLLGTGSCFSFTAEFGLPAGRELGQEARPVPARTTGGKKPLAILLAEDNTVNRFLAVELLHKEGHQVDAVENGREALEKLRHKPYDVVLMDVRMPDMDGEAAVRAIRRGEAGEARKGVPVIALTAHAFTGDRERFLAAGMDDYVSKPFDLKELTRVLERVLTAA